MDTYKIKTLANSTAAPLFMSSSVICKLFSVLLRGIFSCYVVIGDTYGVLGQPRDFNATMYCSIQKRPETEAAFNAR
jgi:hypothetical protein